MTILLRTMHKIIRRKSLNCIAFDFFGNKTRVVEVTPCGNTTPLGILIDYNLRFQPICEIGCILVMVREWGFG